MQRGLFGIFHFGLVAGETRGVAETRTISSAHIGAWLESGNVTFSINKSMKKIVVIAALILGMGIGAAAQEKITAVLTGTLYDPNGAVIVGAKVTATDEKGNKFQAISNDEGKYSFQLPYCRYGTSCRTRKYDIQVVAHGFAMTRINNYLFVPADAGPNFPKKMILDIALEVGTSHEISLIR